MITETKKGAPNKVMLISQASRISVAATSAAYEHGDFMHLSYR